MSPPSFSFSLAPPEFQGKPGWHAYCSIAEWETPNQMRAKTLILGAATFAALLLVAIPAGADSASTVDLTSQFQGSGLDVDGLRAVEVGGIVVLRGRTTDAAVAQRAGVLAQSLGYARVANLIQVVPPPDDAAIERVAERQLAMRRSLDGCSFHLDSHGGVLTVAGKVTHELQKDIAVNVLRNIDGVRSVKASFSPVPSNQ
jgi:osmotically-inducible protein OsmY